jgi:hypothetical protein
LNLTQGQQDAINSGITAELVGEIGGAVYDVVSKSANGLAPRLPDETSTTKFLRQDGTWVVPPNTNTTYAVVSKSVSGLVPVLPNETSTSKFFRQDGSWTAPILFAADEEEAESVSMEIPNTLVFFPEISEPPSEPPSEPSFAGFGMVINSGSDSRFILPLRYGDGTAHHELTIDWGDGGVQTVTGDAGTASTFSGLSHVFPAANTNYTINITGTTYLGSVQYTSYFGLGFHDNTYPIGFNSPGNKAKVLGLTGCLENIVSEDMRSRSYCYANAFYGCTSLTSISATLLPATVLAQNCYYSMFRGCTGLTELPPTLLPATTLAEYCYSYMFYGCTGLAELPATLLPALTLTYYCYYHMFYNCTGLTTIYMTPDWFAKPGQPSMFSGCINITANTSYANIPDGYK